MNPAEEKELIERHGPLVREVVDRYRPNISAEIGTDDLIKAGTAGLAKAARTFDPQGGIPFATFAAARIRGALLDEMLRRYRSPKRDRQEISVKEGSLPAPFSYFAEEQDDRDEWKMGPRLLKKGEDAAEAAKDKKMLQQLLAKHGDVFSEQQKRICELYWFQDRRLADIAVALGLPESRVCQIHMETLLSISEIKKAENL